MQLGNANEIVFKGHTNVRTLKDALVSSKQRKAESKKNSMMSLSSHGLNVT